jgi:hypothetical protein
MTTSSARGGADRALVLVAGSGRSGTSLFAGLGNQLGMYIPQPEVKADASNPRGFGEPRWAVDFHEGLLRSVAVTPEDARPAAWELTAKVARREPARVRLHRWLQEQFEIADRVVVKDPRLGWFLDLYQSVGAALDVPVRVVTMVRHPAASVKSRQLAYGTRASDVRRLVGWLNMMLFVEHRTRHLPRALVGYDSLLTDWSDTLAATEEALRVPILSGASEQQRTAAAALVDPSLRRADPDWSLLDVPAELQDLGEETFVALSAAVVGATGDQQADGTALDRARARYQQYYATAEAVARSSITAAQVAGRRKAEQEHRRRDRSTARSALRRLAAGARSRYGRVAASRWRR